MLGRRVEAPVDGGWRVLQHSGSFLKVLPRATVFGFRLHFGAQGNIKVHAGFILGSLCSGGPFWAPGVHLGSMFFCCPSWLHSFPILAPSWLHFGS